MCMCVHEVMSSPAINSIAQILETEAMASLAELIHILLGHAVILLPSTFPGIISFPASSHVTKVG